MNDKELDAIEAEDEDIDGFSIRKRELTEEEATRDITYDRFRAYHMEVGEDFTDQHTNIVNGHVLGGWLLGKRPEWKVEICKILNDYPSSQDFFHLYVEELPEEHEECYTAFYTDYAEFLNLTGAAKKRVNQILVQIAEHYGTPDQD